MKVWINIKRIFALLLFSNTLFAHQAPLFNNLGSEHYPIATQNKFAQRFFDQGMILFYGYEWGEAARSFKEATRYDPSCAMCYWGVALALSHKVNAPITGHEYAEGQLAIQNAKKFKESETDVHQALIAALAKRFEHFSMTKRKGEAFSCHGTSGGDISEKQRAVYASEMKKLVAQFPNDINAKVLAAAAIFWSAADEHPSGFAADKPDPELNWATQILEDVIKKDSRNVGANHYYIHITEPYPHPERALASAKLFETAVPGSEHLVHMPAHIYFLTGRYHEASASNQQAIAVFKDYNIECKKQGFKPESNYLYFHNYDFLRTSAVMEGRKETAVTAVHELLSEPFPSVLKSEADFQWFIPIELFVYARFGMWDEILQKKAPNIQAHYATGMWHYARGLAFVHLNKLTQAKKEYSELSRMIGKGKPERFLGEKGQSLLIIARTVLNASLAGSQGDHQTAINQLRIAVKLQEQLGYHEPPDWYFPTKEILAEAYFHAGNFKLAEQWYEKDLKQYPSNGWALYGLQKSLQQQGKLQQAKMVEDAFKKAWRYADIEKPVAFFDWNN